MLQKMSLTVVSDGTGLGWLQVIHSYRGSWRRYCLIGIFCKLAVQTIDKYPSFI